GRSPPPPPPPPRGGGGVAPVAPPTPRPPPRGGGGAPAGPETFSPAGGGRGSAVAGRGGGETRGGRGGVRAPAGHRPGAGGAAVTWLAGERVATVNTHGSGCVFSAAITAGLARGLPLPDALREAKAFIAGAIRHSLAIGGGHGPVNPMWRVVPSDS